MWRGFLIEKWLKLWVFYRLSLFYPSFHTSCRCYSFPVFVMVPNLADTILTNVPLPTVPPYLTKYIIGETPLSTWPSVCTALVSYLAIVFGTREVMKGREPQRLNTLFRIHNAFLSGGSLLLLALMMEEVFPIVYNQGLFAAGCAVESWTPVSSPTTCAR